MSTNELVQIVATLAAGLFTGASVYINAVEHPARLSCGIEVAAAQWLPSYKRATVMQVALAILGFATGVAAWFQGAGGLWLAGAVLLVTVIPYTAVVVLPTNRKLMDPKRDSRSSDTGALLARWGRLHAVRSVLSLLAFLLFVVAR